MVEGVDVPESDGFVLAHSDEVSLSQVEVHLQNLVSVASQQCRVLLIGFVQDTQRSVEGATHHFESVWRDVDCADRSLVLGLHEELREIERPDSEIEKEYKDKHKNWRRHWEFPPDFPSTEVIKAYELPYVDESKDKFTWGVPAFKELRDFAMRNLNWSNRELDQYLTQVSKKMEEFEHKKKGTLDSYFKREEKFADVKSHRVA